MRKCPRSSAANRRSIRCTGSGKWGKPGHFAKQRVFHRVSALQVSQKFGGEQASKKVYGGDEELPQRQPLNERRLKYDAAAARKAARAAGDGDSDDYDAGATDCSAVYYAFLS